MELKSILVVALLLFIIGGLVFLKIRSKRKH
jgi:cbb3-type cytochrome oxidase subunit 3